HDPQEAAASLRPCSVRFAQPLDHCRLHGMRANAAQNELFRPDLVGAFQSIAHVFICPRSHRGKCDK
ncbi:hypothetical protein, partial [Paraburkholderia sp. Ac-20342]|uniref:hypothetical protein n=1 Tax=Paraburkholderia sp. Ac-20342 TaxID=2703889 RepID=UPI00197D0A7F